MDRYLTTESHYGITIIVERDLIILSDLPMNTLFRVFMVLLFSANGSEVARISATPISRSVSLHFPSLPEGLYYLCLYLESPRKRGQYFSFLKFGDIPIAMLGGVLAIMESIVAPHNRVFLNNLPKYDRRTLEPTAHIQSQNINIRNLARQIAQGKTDRLDIIKSVHSWVALNISYDYDSLEDDIHIIKDNTALGAYVGRKCVCRGYTNLTIALLRSLHIPSVKVYCRAIDIISDGNWGERDNVQAAPNHVFPAAWIGNRWVIMDTTWDSKNIFEDGHFSRGNDIVFPYKYFDASIDFISQTHRFDLYDY